jgi:DNA-binding MarR family transcriptional regulator
MNSERFGKFVLLIDGIHKSIQKIKLNNSHSLGLKGVHTLWMYELLRHPDGMTASELAATSMIDRSLVSRELSELSAQNYIKVEKDLDKRSYNTKISLTESGRRVALEVESIALEVQKEASYGISREELESFYTTLEKLNKNISNIAEESGSFQITKPKKNII